MAFFVRRKPCWCSLQEFPDYSLEKPTIYTVLQLEKQKIQQCTRMTICIDADEKTFRTGQKQLNRSVGSY